MQTCRHFTFCFSSSRPDGVVIGVIALQQDPLVTINTVLSLHCFHQYAVLSAVCCSLVNKSGSLDQNDWSNEESVWTQLKKMGTQITLADPEFILKVNLNECVCVCVDLCQSLTNI